MQRSELPSYPKDDLDHACEELAAGKCVAIPTETVYGLAADATNGLAVARIFKLKNRPEFNPLICHVDGLDMAQRYGKLNTTAKKLAEIFWPGPLTLVVPLKENSGIHPLVTAELGTIGIRHPKGIASQLISQFGKPLAAPSANRSGRISPTRYDHVTNEFSDSDLFVLLREPCEVGIESTIVSIHEDRIVLLRPGVITQTMLEEATGLPVHLPQGDIVLAPGMMKSHYAPNLPLRIDCTQCPDDAAWLQFGPSIAHHGPVKNLSAKSDLQEAAANLYAHLKALDATNASMICVSPTPLEELGIAINDRLKRAAAPRTGS